MNHNPKISIITICKNSDSTIIKCVESVLSQTYKNVEYIIIDGASTDKTINIINNFKENISKIISEPDNGIYDAMNKGITASSGDFILFLNADDYLISENAIDSFVQFINSESEADIYYGKVLLFNKISSIGSIWKAANVSKFSLYRGSIPHQAAFCKKKSFDKCGLFDTSYKIAGDYEWFVRALIKFNLKFVRTEIIISVFNKGGISTNNADLIIKKENEKIRTAHYNYWERKYYNFRWFIKKI